MKRQILILLGVSGVGKTTLIKEIQRLDSRFIYVKPYTNRPLRLNETEKIYKNDVQLKSLIDDGHFLFVNNIYGYTYATHKSILDYAQKNSFPILDFPEQKIRSLKNIIPNMIYSVYILPPNIDKLKYRLSDGRDTQNLRFNFALEEIAALQTSYVNDFDSLVINEDGKVSDVAMFIYNQFMASNC